MDKKYRWMAAGASVGMVLLAGSTAVSAVTLSQLTALRTAVEQSNTLNQSTEEHATAEDGVKIMNGTYTIESTTDISDAYISGDTSKLDDRQKETLDMASAVLEQIISEGMTDFEKEKAVYDWMTTKLSNDSGLLTVIPTSGDDSDNPYGVLKYHNAVCVGYATTFRLFMQMMGIECHVVHNSELYHSWDLVKLDDGYYHVDIYSDAEKGNYAHFNLTDSMMADSENWDTSFYPHADSLTYNMAYQNRVTCKDIYELPSALRTAMDDGDRTLCVAFRSEIIDQDAEVGNAICETLNENLETLAESEEGSGYPYIINSHTWQQNPEGGYMLMVTMDYLTYSTDTLDDAAKQKVSESMQKAFGDLLPDMEVTTDYDVVEEEG